MQDEPEQPVAEIGVEEAKEVFSSEESFPSDVSE